MKVNRTNANETSFLYFVYLPEKVFAQLSKKAVSLLRASVETFKAVFW